MESWEVGMRGNNNDKNGDYDSLELIHPIPFQKHKIAGERAAWPIVSLKSRVN